MLPADMLSRMGHEDFCGLVNLAEIEDAVFERLRAVVDDLADLLRLPFSSALCTTLSRVVISAYKSLTAGTKLHVGIKGKPLVFAAVYGMPARLDS